MWNSYHKVHRISFNDFYEYEYYKIINLYPRWKLMTEQTHAEEEEKKVPIEKAFKELQRQKKMR